MLARQGSLLELLQMNEVAHHLLRRDAIEQSQHPRQKYTILAAAELLGHNDSRMGLPGSLALVMQRREIANVESKDGPTLGCREFELFFVIGCVFASLFSGQNVKSAFTQINR